MKKFIATSLAFVMLLASLGETTNAAPKKSIFNRPLNLGCSVKCDMGSFSQPANFDETMSVFYSTQGKLTLLNPECLTKNSYVSVNVAQPLKERKWWTLWLWQGKVDPRVNSFLLKLSKYKPACWNIPERIFCKICELLGVDKNVCVKCAIVLTTKDEEKILETPEVKEGQKKKEVLDDEKRYEQIEKLNGKDPINAFKERYLEIATKELGNPQLLPDGYNIVQDGHIDSLRVHLQSIDKSKYYTKKEADEENKKIREAKAAVVAKLAQKCGDELITEGEVARLSQINKEQTFRLIVNNNIGEGGEADKLVLILSNLAATGQSINDDSSIEFVSYVQSVLPERFNNPLTETDRRNIARAYEALEAAKYKPGFFKWLWNGIKYLTPDIVKDFLSTVGNVIRYGTRKSPEVLQQLQQQTQLEQDQQQLQQDQQQLRRDREQLQQDQRDQQDRDRQAALDRQQIYINQQNELMNQRQQMLNQQARANAGVGRGTAQPAQPINVTVNPTITPTVNPTINPNFNTQHNEGNGINGLATNARPAPAGATGVAAPAGAQGLEAQGDNP